MPSVRRVPRMVPALAALGVLAAALTAGACRSNDQAAVDAARKKDESVLFTRASEVDRRGPLPWVVVADGALAGFGATAEDALRAAGAKADAPHRFVFRAEDRGDRLWRLAFVPDGGRVAGRRLLEDLGFRVVHAGVLGPGRRVTLERRGERSTLDLGRTPRLRIELTPLGGGPAVAVEATLDPDFDGPLLVDAATAAALRPERAEIPGGGEVQVALGRPMTVRRAWAAARCETLGASGLAEVAVPDAPLRR